MKRFTIAACMSALFAFSASAATVPALVVPSNPKGQPESMAAGPDGTLYLGSLDSPIVYRAKPGETTAQPFIDMRANKSQLLLGVFADAPTKTLWVCEIFDMQQKPLIHAHSTMHAFDLDTGAEKAKYPLPGDNNVCNDFAIAPDHTLYLSDTSAARILRLKPGAKQFDTLIQDASLFGIDGITLLNGTLYVNTIWAGGLYRIPVDASGKAGAPVQLVVDRILKAPDGMRAANGKLFVGEGAGGAVSEITITGDKAHVTTVKSGLTAPTGLEPAGTTLWIADRGASKVISVPLPK